MSLAHLRNVKQNEGENLKSFLNHFITELSRVRWAPDAGVLAHLTNGVLPKTPFWDELQQKECKSVNEFYKKASKFLKLENSKEACIRQRKPPPTKRMTKERKLKGRKKVRKEEQMISEAIA